MSRPQLLKLAALKDGELFAQALTGCFLRLNAGTANHFEVFHPSVRNGVFPFCYEFSLELEYYFSFSSFPKIFGPSTKFKLIDLDNLCFLHTPLQKYVLKLIFFDLSMGSEASSLV